MELWFMPCMLSDVILPSTPTVASTLSAVSAKLDTFKRLQAADVRAYDEVCLRETRTKSRTALLWGDPPRLQRAAICSFCFRGDFGRLSDYLGVLANPPTAFNRCWTDADIRVREDVVALLVWRRFGRRAAKAGLGDCGDAWSKRNKR